MGFQCVVCDWLYRLGFGVGSHWQRAYGWGAGGQNLTLFPPTRFKIKGFLFVPPNVRIEMAFGLRYMDFV